MGKIPAVELEHTPWLPPVNIFAAAQLCYDDEALYVRLSAKEKEIRAEYSGILDLPCLDSCLEFFFSPIEEDERYINIEFNPNTCLFFGIGNGSEHMRVLPDKGCMSPCVIQSEDIWELL